MPLVRAKLERPAPVPHVVRRRVNELLEASVRSALATLVVGRAGTGKTLAAVDFADRASGRVAWLTVDASDTDFERFATYLLESLGLRANSGLALLPSERFAMHLVSELADCADAPRFVILEDLHLVYDAPWFGPFIGQFLPMLPRNVHALLTARAFPPVPLWRMRSKQSLSVVDEDALAFTDLEGIQLFARYGLGEATARTAVRTTRGRAVRLDGVARHLAGHAHSAEGVGAFVSRPLVAG